MYGRILPPYIKSIFKYSKILMIIKDAFFHAITAKIYMNIIRIFGRHRKSSMYCYSIKRSVYIANIAHTPRPMIIGFIDLICNSIFNDSRGSLNPYDGEQWEEKK